MTYMIDTYLIDRYEHCTYSEAACKQASFRKVLDWIHLSRYNCNKIQTQQSAHQGIYSRLDAIFNLDVELHIKILKADGGKCNHLT